MFRRTARIATSRIVAVTGILLGILPLLPLIGLHVPLIIAYQALIYLVGSAGLGMLAVWLGCRWGWLALGLAIVHFGMDVVYMILSSAQNF